MKQLSNSTINYSLLLFLSALFLTGCGRILYTPPTPEEHCDIDPALLEPTYAEQAEEGKTVLTLWATAERLYCWRAYAPLVAANQRPALQIAVRVSNLEINEGPLADQLMDLATEGEAPDLAFLFNHQAVRLGEAGHLYPLESCRQRPEFHQIPDRFWKGFTLDGQAWGIPVDAEVMHLFYNKVILGQLGWTEAEIDALPNRIAAGDYTQDDLVATAREAVRQRLVTPGLAFIPNRNQRGMIESLYAHHGGRFYDATSRAPAINQQSLEETYEFLEALHKHQLLDRTLTVPSFGDWGNKLLMRDAATHQRLLFWQAYISEFPRMAMDYTWRRDRNQRSTEIHSVASPQPNFWPAKTGATSRTLRNFFAVDALYAGWWHGGGTEIHTEIQEKNLCESLFSGSVDLCDASDDIMQLSQRIGYAMLPPSEKGQPGYVRLINAGQYVIFAKQATGRANQEAACHLIAATHASGLLQRHTHKSGHITFSRGHSAENLSSESVSPESVSMENPSSVSTSLANEPSAGDLLYLPTWFPSPLPLERLIWPPAPMPKSSEYSNVLVEAAIQVERGELGASEAAAQAVESLRDIFGSQLIME